MWVGALYISIHVHREKIVAMWKVTFCISINTEMRVQCARVHSTFLYTEKRSDKWGRYKYISIHRENRVAMWEGTLNISIQRENRVAMWEGALCS